MREKMIYEAKIKRDQEKNYHRENERAQVAKLQAEIEKERTSKIQKKIEERAAAQKVIQENQLEKAKRVKEIDMAR